MAVFFLQISSLPWAVRTRREGRFWTTQDHFYIIYTVFHLGCNLVDKVFVITLENTKFQLYWKINQNFTALFICVRNRSIHNSTRTSSSPAPEPEDSTFSAPIIACLTVHTKTSGTGNKKKTTKKDMKTKEFTHTFCATKSNYIELLNTILTKHHIGNKLQVTEHRHYSCKMQVPPAK